MNQVEVLKNPIKSTGDKKEYRLIRLPNHLTALLVRKANGNPSDADSEDLAAANVTVKIGSFDDPTNAQGLAHFLEHMVHMGSSRYPKESEYNDFLTANGGRRNALTSAEYTSYYFAVSEKAFPEAVDRLEQLMEKPLLLQNSMQREREAVDSEFQMQVSSDAARVQSIFKVLIRESHPASKFNCGNLKTLKEEITDDDLHRELMKLHERYVGRNMFVSLQSQRTLDEMQEIIVKNFSSIKSGNNEEILSPTLTPDEIFTPEFFNKIHFIKPKTSKKALIVSWAFPKMDQHYKCAPLDYIKKIFRNSGEGGIASVLRESHLSSDMGLYLEPNSFVSNSSFSLVRIVADLTDHGAENVDKILEAIFSYLLMIKETSIDEHRRFYNELKEQSENDFNFHEESSAVDNVLDFVTNMITFEPQDYLRGNSLFQQFDEKLIVDAIEMLNQRKFNVIILDNKHESYNKREKYFGTEYDELDFPESYKKLWNERKANPNFFLEKFNPYKTSNFEIFENEEESQKFPMKISEDGSFESWHKLDNKFKNPFAIFKLNLFSPIVSSSKENCIMIKLYEKVLIFNLKKKLAQASSAGYSVTSGNDKNGISLTFQGYNEKMSLLVDTTTKFMPKAVNETEASTLNVLKNEMKDLFYEQLRTSQGLNGDVMAKVLLDGHYPKFELYEEIDNISYEKLQKFTMEFFRALKVQVLVQGNILKSETSNITNLVLNNLDCEKLTEEFETKTRCYEIPQGETVLRVKSLQLNDDNSILRDFYQIGRDTLRSRCLARLVVAILNPKAYDYLRSKEQLGYGVGVQFEEKGRVIGVNVVVLSQESKHTYEEVGRKMKVFMNEVSKKTIEELTDEEFQGFKDARIKLLSADDLDLDTEIKRNWYEINDQEYRFDRNELAVKLTKGFTKAEFQDYFKTFFLSENVRKLSLQMIGNKKTSDNLIPGDVNLNFLTEKLDENEKIITDIKAFQRNLNLYSIGFFEM